VIKIEITKARSKGHRIEADSFLKGLTEIWLIDIDSQDMASMNRNKIGLVFNKSVIRNKSKITEFKG
jgi:hypothetical protein